MLLFPLEPLPYINHGYLKFSDNDNICVMAELDPKLDSSDYFFLPFSLHFFFFFFFAVVRTEVIMLLA